MPNRLEQQISFILELDKLKHIMRQSDLLNVSRKENDAEHSWHLAVMAMVLHEYAAEPGTDLQRVMELVLVHDLVEIDAGDTFLYDAEGNADKSVRECAAADRIFGLLPADQQANLRELWEEFEAGQTPESRFARTIDCVEPLLLSYHTRGRMWQERGVTLTQVLDRCSATLMNGSPRLAEYMLTLIHDAQAQGFLADADVTEE